MITDMQLQLLTPTRVAVEALASKVIAQAPNGHFCLLPRHADFVTTLIPGLFSWWDALGQEQLLATDEGTLIKCGRDVQVSVREAIRGDDLATLRDAVEREFVRLDERERQARSALARLEAGAIRGAGALVSSGLG